MIDNSIADRRNKKPKREPNIIDFKEEIIFYEDSEGDLNVISEDEDLVDALQYVTQRQKKTLRCSIINKNMFE